MWLKLIYRCVFDIPADYPIASSIPLASPVLVQCIEEQTNALMRRSTDSQEQTEKSLQKKTDGMALFWVSIVQCLRVE